MGLTTAILEIEASPVAKQSLQSWRCSLPGSFKGHTIHTEGPYHWRYPTICIEIHRCAGLVPKLRRFGDGLGGVFIVAPHALTCGKGWKCAHSPAAFCTDYLSAHREMKSGGTMSRPSLLQSIRPCPECNPSFILDRSGNQQAEVANVEQRDLCRPPPRLQHLLPQSGKWCCSNDVTTCRW